MSEYYIHTTSENERWDNLATQYYGNCYEIADIIRENPHIPISPVLKTGTLVKIPVKKPLTASNLPIWKR